MNSIDQFSMTDPEVARCPYAYYAAMRRERPVHRDPGTGFYWVSSADTVARLAADPQALSSRSDVLLRKSFQPRAQALWDAAGMQAIDTFVTGDPPDHEHYRALGMPLFNPKKVAEMAPRIEACVHELLDALAERTEIEFVEEFAARLPGTIVCDEFGLPKEDQPKFKAWTDAVIALQTPGISEDFEVEKVTLVIELFQYLQAHLERSGEQATGRIIHALATVPRLDGTSFSPLERAWMLVFIFGGSNETTINMLASGIRRLAIDTPLQSRLRGDPSQIPAFIEELLRLDGSVQSLFRVATQDLEVDGTQIPKGSNVMLCVSSANRDEKRWTEPEAFSLERKDGRRHYSFGQGPHMCIGAHLARRMLNIAFSILLERLDTIELAVLPSDIEQIPLPFHRGIAALPIRFKRSKQRDGSSAAA